MDSMNFLHKLEKRKPKDSPFHPLVRDYVKKIRVLIIDNDIDAIIPIDGILRGFGCQTAYAIDAEDATQKICTNKVDLIILDWCLGNDTGAGVIYKCIEVIKKTKALRNQFLHKNLKIITYSGRKSEKCLFKGLEFFEHLGHLEKASTLSEIRLETVKILMHMKF